MFDLKMLGAGVAVAAAVVMAPSSAHAVALTSGGINYEVTATDPISFFSNIGQLGSTPWWTDESGRNADGSPNESAGALAKDLATELASELGLPNVPPVAVEGEGPYFAFGLNQTESGAFRVSAWNWDVEGSVGFVELDVQNNILDTPYVWAVGEAAAVPTPALLPAMLGMGASIVRKRKKQA